MSSRIHNLNNELRMFIKNMFKGSPMAVIHVAYNLKFPSRRASTVLADRHGGGAPPSHTYDRWICPWLNDRSPVQFVTIIVSAIRRATSTLVMWLSRLYTVQCTLYTVQCTACPSFGRCNLRPFCLLTVMLTMFGARGKLVVHLIVHAFSEAKLVLFFVDNKTWPLTTSSSTNFSIHSLFPFYYISPEVLEQTYTSSFLSFSSLFRAASLNTYRTIINNDVYSKNMKMRSVKKAVFGGTPWPGTWGTCPKAPYTTLCNIYYSAVKMIP